MTDFKAWIPPAGEVVEAPVHPQTRVNVIYSDGAGTDSGFAAGLINWSSVGDGPSIVAYRVIEEYKPAPQVAREWWVARGRLFLSRKEAQIECIDYEPHAEVIHVREVLEGREVVAWAVVDDRDGDTTAWECHADAKEHQAVFGGTVVRLSGVMPA